jgi:hypothetical protein
MKEKEVEGGEERDVNNSDSSGGGGWIVEVSDEGRKMTDR